MEISNTLNDGLDLIVKRIHAAEFKEAEQQAIYFLKTSPQNARLWFMLGVAQQSQGKLLPAVGALLESIGLEPQNINAINACALCYQLLKKSELAHQMMLKAFALAPDDPQVISNLASSYEQLGQFQEALDHYDLALKYDPDYLMAWQNRGILLKVLDRKADWLKSNLEAFKRHPNSPEVVHNLTYACIANFEYT